MKNSIWCGLLALAFISGWAVGRHGNDSRSAEVSSGSPGRPNAPASHEARQEREAKARQWAEKVNDRSLTETPAIFSGLDSSLRGATLEAWFNSLGQGGLTNELYDKLHAMLDAWAAVDFDGARSWALTLKDPATRQMSLEGLAGAIHDKDPEKALECFAANGPFNFAIHDTRICDLMTELSKKALASGGADALLKLWQRLPEGTERVTGFFGISFPLPPDTDFRSVLEIQAQLQESRRPVYMTGVMEQWAEHDRAEASAYIAETAIRSPLPDAWQEMRSVIEAKEGKAASEAWAREFFNNIPAENLPDLLINTRMLYSPQSVLSSLPADATPEERNRLVAALIETSDRTGNSMQAAILQNVPVTERLAALSTARGITNPDPILEQAAKTGATEPELQQLKELITRPR